MPQVGTRNKSPPPALRGPIVIEEQAGDQVCSDQYVDRRIDGGTMAHRCASLSHSRASSSFVAASAKARPY
jgi:hypothetical protein